MFTEVLHHRLKYFLSPQLDLYKNVRTLWERRKQKFGLCQSGYNVIDYGCGNGIGLVSLMNIHDNCIGIDSDSTAIAFAKDVFGHLASFHHENWASLSDVDGQPDNCVDLLVCIEVIEHIADPKPLLTNLRRMMHPQGLAIFSTLNHNSQYRKNHCHVGKYHVDDFRALIHTYFSAARITDYLLENELQDDSTCTPVVAIWEGQ